MDADNTQFGAGTGSAGAGDLGTTGTTGTTGNMGSSFGATEEQGGVARGIAGTVRNAASQAKAKAGEQVTSSIDKGRTRAADTLQEVARTLMGETAAENPASQYLTKAGEQVQRFADYLQNTEPRQLVAETENFARRQPALFLGGAFAIGVLAARFLKSTRPDDQFSGGYEGGSQGLLYDRETALSSYREPVDYSAGSTTTPLGDDEMDWPSGLGNVDGTTGGATGTSNTSDGEFGSGGYGTNTGR